MDEVSFALLSMADVCADLCAYGLVREMEELPIEWTDYMRYRAAVRRFDLARIEEVVRYSTERYVDNATGRLVAIGRYGSQLLMVPYELEGGAIRPVTVHAATRRQVEARIKSGRSTHE